VVQYIRFQSVQPGLCIFKAVGFQCESKVFMLHKPVVALCKLVLEHGGVFLPHIIKTVLLRRYGNTL
jgi:hypothetical protein